MLWRYFALFAIAILAMLWMLQTVFLQAFYDASVKAGVHEGASSIERAWTSMPSEDFPDELDAISSDKSLLIFVTTWDKDVLFGTDEHSAAYAAESANEDEGGESGSYSWRTEMKGQDDPEDGEDAVRGWQLGQSRYLGLTQGFDAFLEKLGDNPSTPVEYQDEDGSLYTYGIALPSSGEPGSACEQAGAEAVLYISTTLQPVGATASAIRTQLALASAVALLLAFALALALARRFAKPVVSLTRKAEALGDAGANNSEKPSDVSDGFCAELDNLSRAVDEAAIELAEVEQRRSEFMANVSHDLRTPLTLIKGYAEAARDDLRDGLSVDERDLEVVAREADRLADLANELLDYSKLKAAVTAPVMAQFDASEAFGSIVALFFPLAERAGITVETAIEPSVRLVGDEAQLVRVVSNLVDNAVSHTPEGGKVTVTLATADQRVRLEVADTGEGIGEKDIEHVWERYFTRKQAARNAKGSGLGLAISKEILEAHGASYGAASNDGAGSLFWFEIDSASAGR